MTWSPAYFSSAITCRSFPHPLGSSPHWSLSPLKRPHQHHLKALLFPSGHLPPSRHFCIGSSVTSSESFSRTRSAASTPPAHQVTVLRPFVCFVALINVRNTVLIYLFICLMCFSLILLPQQVSSTKGKDLG